MADLLPNPTPLLPKLRRRSRGSKGGKGKGKQTPYASRGLEKFALVVAELQARRASMAEKDGTPVSVVSFLSRSAKDWTTDSFTQTLWRAEKNKLEPFLDEVAPVVVKWADEHTVHPTVSEDVSVPASADFLSSRSQVSMNSGEHFDEARHSEGDCQRCESLQESRESNRGDSFLNTSSVLLSRETTSMAAFPELGLRGIRSRRRPMYVLEKRWKQSSETFVTMVVTLGVFFVKRVADLGGSVLAALSFGVVIRRWGRGKKYVSRLFFAIVKYVLEPWHSYVSAMAKKCLLSTSNERDIDAGARGLSISPMLEHENLDSHFVLPLISADSPPPSPSMLLSANQKDSITSPPSESSPVCDTTSAPVSPRNRVSSPPSSVESSSPTASKLNQFKSKIFRSFPLNKSVQRERDLRFTAPSTSNSVDSLESFGCSERWDSDTASSMSISEYPNSISRDDLSTKKKKYFLQRRSLSRNDAEEPSGKENLESNRPSSPCRSRFSNLRINTSVIPAPEATSSPSSPLVRLGKLRSSTSMKDSPKSTVKGERPSSPCKSGLGKLRMSFTQKDNPEIVLTPEVTSSPSSPSIRLGKLRISTSMKDSPKSLEKGEQRPGSPCKSGLGKLRISFSQKEATEIKPKRSVHSNADKTVVPQSKKHYGDEVWLVGILLVSLLVLSFGRVPAILATSFAVLFVAWLDKMRHRGGVGRESDSARRALEASWKLRKSSTPVSPRLASPRNPWSGSPRSSFADVLSNEYRQRVIMDRLLERKKCTLWCHGGSSHHAGCLRVGWGTIGSLLIMHRRFLFMETMHTDLTEGAVIL